MASTLLPLATVLALTNHAGVVFKDSHAAIDTANADAQVLLTDLQALQATDLVQGTQLFPYALGIYAPASGSATPFGVGGGGFGAGQGSLNRDSFYKAAFFAWLESLRVFIRRYGQPLGAIDLSTYAAYQNGLTAHSCLYSPDFAALYWYAYNQAQQLAPASVFAPVGVKCADVTITAANTGTLTTYAPFTNGYSTPTPTNDSYGNAVYQGGLPMAQGFAPFATSRCHVSVTINGTCAVTVHALNQAGAAAMWTATLDSVTAGSSVTLTPGMSGDRIAASPTSISIIGAATAGAFSVECASLERSY